MLELLTLNIQFAQILEGAKNNSNLLTGKLDQKDIHFYVYLNSTKI